jgi:hypothetical protein
MSADFEKVLVKDPRLDVSDSIKYAVVKGGQNVTASPFKAISESNSQVVWNIQVPSEQTIVDRRVLWTSTLQFEVGAEGASQAYGITWALASFPLHQLLSVMSATINNNTVSLNVNDVLPAIIRMICCDDLVYYNSSSPTFADTQASYTSVPNNFNNHNNPLASLWACENNRNPHRGCFAPYSVAANVWTFKLTEPLLISPFIFGNLKANGQGFYGIQNMNFILNKNSNQARVVRGNAVVVANSVSTSGGGSTPSSSLLFMFLTPHPSDLMPARNIVPFYELPRYITSAGALLDSTLASGPIAAVTGSTILNTLQLNQIPDKLIVYIRKVPTNVSTEPDVALPIRNISINFNNNSGILASADPVQLWEMSRNNGLQSSWNDYNGFAITNTQAGDLDYKWVGTVGSYLVLEFGRDIQLTEDFYACGSLGNFNLQVTLNYVNNTATAYAAGDLQIVLITMNSGVFVCERGTSSTYTGILTKQDVLEASQQDHYTHNDVARLVGGGIFDMIKSGVKSLGSKALQMGKEHLKKHGKEYLNKGLSMAKHHGKKALAKYLKPKDDDDE